MIYHYDYRWLGFLVLVILLGAVVLGALAANPPYPLSPQAVARAQTVVARTGTPEPITPTGDATPAGTGVNLEWTVIIALIVFIAGLIVGVALSRPIIRP